MAEPVADGHPPVLETAAEPVVAAPAEPAPPVVAETVAHEPPPPSEPVRGDTPLSALERLAAPVDLSSRVRRRDRVLTAAWAASFAALAGLGVAGYTQRNVLMQQWPASKRVYATLGLVSPDMTVRNGKETTGPRVP